MSPAAAASVSRDGRGKPAKSQPVPTTALRMGYAMTSYDSALVWRATQVRGTRRFITSWGDSLDNS